MNLVSSASSAKKNGDKLEELPMDRLALRLAEDDPEFLKAVRVIMIDHLRKRHHAA